jgi:hypothetical protein
VEGVLDGVLVSVAVGVSAELAEARGELVGRRGVVVRVPVGRGVLVGLGVGGALAAAEALVGGLEEADWEGEGGEVLVLLLEGAEPVGLGERPALALRVGLSWGVADEEREKESRGVIVRVPVANAETLKLKVLEELKVAVGRGLWLYAGDSVEGGVREAEGEGRALRDGGSVRDTAGERVPDWQGEAERVVVPAGEAEAVRVGLGEALTQADKDGEGEAVGHRVEVVEGLLLVTMLKESWGEAVASLEAELAGEAEAVRVGLGEALTQADKDGEGEAVGHRVEVVEGLLLVTTLGEGKGEAVASLEAESDPVDVEKEDSRAEVLGEVSPEAVGVANTVVASGVNVAQDEPLIVEVVNKDDDPLAVKHADPREVMLRVESPEADGEEIRVVANGVNEAEGEVLAVEKGEMDKLVVGTEGAAEADALEERDVVIETPELGQLSKIKGDCGVLAPGQRVYTEPSVPGNVAQ